MPEIKRDCFAYLSDDKCRGCFALNQLYCKTEECKFYQKKSEAREKYLDNYTIYTAANISKTVDIFFRKNCREED